MEQKNLVAPCRPSLGIQLIADKRAVQVHIPALISMDDAVLSTSDAAEFRYPVGSCVHGSRFSMSRDDAGNQASGICGYLHQCFELSESQHHIWC